MSEPSFNDWSRVCSHQMASRENFVVGGLDTARRHILSMTGGRCRFLARSGRDARAYGGAQARVGSIAFQFLRWDWEAECETWTTRSPDDHVVIYIPLRGVFEARLGTLSAEARMGQFMVAASEGELRRRWQGPCELLNVVISRKALERTLAVDFAIDACRPLAFEPLATMEFGEARTLLRFIEMLICDGAQPSSVFADTLAGGHAERTLLHILVKSLPHRYPHLLESGRSGLAPFYVRRAETFMRDNLDRRVTYLSISASKL